MIKINVYINNMFYDVVGFSESVYNNLEKGTNVIIDNSNYTVSSKTDNNLYIDDTN
jgi:hypothetical protein